VSASYRYCDEHGDTLVWERGGPTEPTIFGRWYCPTCQDIFDAALTATGTYDVPRERP
jgi:hypothetical protein